MINESYIATDFKFALATISQIVEENRGNKDIINACKHVSQSLKESTKDRIPMPEANIEITVKFCLNRSKMALKVLDDMYKYSNNEEADIRSDIAIIAEIIDDKIKSIGER